MNTIEAIREIDQNELETVNGGAFWIGVAAGMAAMVAGEAVLGFAEGMYEGFTNGR